VNVGQAGQSILPSVGSLFGLPGETEAEGQPGAQGLCLGS
jgi:hypothetical protein